MLLCCCVCIYGQRKYIDGLLADALHGVRYRVCAEVCGSGEVGVRSGHWRCAAAVKGGDDLQGRLHLGVLDRPWPERRLSCTVYCVCRAFRCRFGVSIALPLARKDQMIWWMFGKGLLSTLGTCACTVAWPRTFSRGRLPYCVYSLHRTEPRQKHHDVTAH